MSCVDATLAEVNKNVLKAKVCNEKQMYIPMVLGNVIFHHVAGVLVNWRWFCFDAGVASYYRLICPINRRSIRQVRANMVRWECISHSIIWWRIRFWGASPRWILIKGAFEFVQVRNELGDFIDRTLLNSPTLHSASVGGWEKGGTQIGLCIVVKCLYFVRRFTSFAFAYASAIPTPFCVIIWRKIFACGLQGCLNLRWTSTFFHKLDKTTALFTSDHGNISLPVSLFTGFQDALFVFPIRGENRRSLHQNRGQSPIPMQVLLVSPPAGKYERDILLTWSLGS